MQIRIFIPSANKFSRMLDSLRLVEKLAKKRGVSVYLVGGLLRDIITSEKNYKEVILGKNPLDIDFAVSRDTLELAQDFSKKIKASFVLLDKKTRCVRVVKKTRDRIVNFDFAQFRASTIERDLRERDFTLNTFILPLEVVPLIKKGKVSLRGSIIDCLGSKKDLEEGILRRAGQCSIEGDPLRILRGFYYSGRFSLKMEENTYNDVKINVGKLPRISSERIRDELFRIFSLPESYREVEQMDRIGIWQEFIPEVEQMKKVGKGGYHHLNVWDHSKETFRQLENLIENKLKLNHRIMDYLNEELA